MDSIGELLANYGAMGIVLTYFIYKDNRTTKELKDTLQSLKETVMLLKERIESE